MGQILGSTGLALQTCISEVLSEHTISSILLNKLQHNNTPENLDSKSRRKRPKLFLNMLPYPVFFG